jgi:hypothetical protein
MAQPPKRYDLPRDLLIVDCPTRATSMNMPVAIQRRLDELAELARTTRASRNELLAALVADAPFDGDRLVQLINNYRQMTVGDVLDQGVDQPDDVDNVVVQMRKPGRPKMKKPGRGA